MGRRRKWMVVGVRLAVYAAALTALLAPRMETPVMQLALLRAPDPTPYLLPVLLILMAGVVIELLSGVLRWR